MTSFQEVIIAFKTRPTIYTVTVTSK